MPSTWATVSVAGTGLQLQDLGPGVAAFAGQVLVEAGQLDAAADGSMHDLRADAAFAHQQARVDQVLDGSAHGGPGQAEAFGERDLVVQPHAGGQFAGLDGLLQDLGDLVVQRHRAVAVDRDRRGRKRH